MKVRDHRFLLTPVPLGSLSYFRDYRVIQFAIQKYFGLV